MRSTKLLKSGYLSLLSIFLILLVCSETISQERAPQTAQETQEILVLEGATLISPERSDPLADSVIVVRDNRIESVGKVGSVSYPAGARVLKLSGKYVIPGLIDSHMHFTGWDTELHLANGITSALEHGAGDWKVAVRDGIAKGKIRGFRLFLSNVGINSGRIHGGPQGYKDFGFLDMWGNGVAYDGVEPEDLQDIRDMDAARIQYSVTSPEQARELVRSYIRNGSDAIKVHHNLDRDIIKAIIEEAHRAGIPVVGHRLDARENAELGFDFIEHTAPVAIATITDKERFQQLKEGMILDPHYLMDPAAFPDLIQKLVKANVYHNPTLSGGWRAANGRQKEYAKEVREYFSQPGLKYVPPERVQKYFNDFEMLDQLSPAQARIFEEGYKKVQQFVKEFSQAGGKLLAGVDSVNTGVPGLGIHQEMELMVDAGVSPMEALKSATIYAAELMRKEKDLGTVEAGKLADLVVLGGDPLAQIRNTRKVETVIIEGKIVDISFHADYKPPIPNPADLSRTGLVRSIPDRLRINEIIPAVATEGSNDIEIELKGKFLLTSKVIFNKMEIRSTFVNPRRLRATIPSRLLRVGTHPIQVTSPMFRGGTDKSNAVFFIVKYR